MKYQNVIYIVKFCPTFKVTEGLLAGEITKLKSSLIVNVLFVRMDGCGGRGLIALEESPFNGELF